MLSYISVYVVGFINKTLNVNTFVNMKILLSSMKLQESAIKCMNCLALLSFVRQTQADFLAGLGSVANAVEHGRVSFSINSY